MKSAKNSAIEMKKQDFGVDGKNIDIYDGLDGKNIINDGLDGKNIDINDGLDG